LVFNRPDTTARVFEAIRKAKPQKLYVSADGPRKGRRGDASKVAMVREIVKNIDWPCDFKKIFHAENLGPMNAQVSALDWFFMQEEEGIILEDDCIPNQYFFFFCQTLLDYYRNDDRIFMISGNNFQDNVIRGKADYYFSIYTHIWGWASWSRVWKKFDKNLTNWPEFRQNGCLKFYHESIFTQKYWENIFDEIYEGNFQRGWDYRFLFTCWSEGALVILPQVNLVSNIGFGENGTNCLDPKSPFSNMPTESISQNLRHPQLICANYHADCLTSKKMFFDGKGIYKILFCILHPYKALKMIFNRIVKACRLANNIVGLN